MKRTSLLPFIYVLSPLLTLLAHNAGQSRWSDAVFPALALVLVTALLFPLFTWLLRGRAAGALGLSLLWLLNFSYGAVVAILGPFDPDGATLTNPVILLPVTAALFLLGAWRLRRQAPPRTLIGAAWVVAAGFVATSLVDLARNTAATRAPSRGALNLAPISPGAVTRRPDIYYLILDRYASNETLKRVYRWNNAPFLDFLRGRGFYVADESRANYLPTAQSLASSLNADHLLSTTALMGRESSNWLPVFDLLKDFRVWRFLEAQGYEYVHCGPNWDPTAHNPHATLQVAPWALPEFASILCETTALYPVLYKIGIANPPLEKYRRIRYQLDFLQEHAGPGRKPRFVFGHFLTPHPPYVFNRDGTFKPPVQADQELEWENYDDQLAWINARIERLVVAIQKAYPEDSQPVIILQGDEGTYPERTRPHSFEWATATGDELREKFLILNAICLPDSGATTYPAMTPVNTFRVIFNAYFGTALPLLDDRSYAYRDLRHLYDFLDVTAALDSTFR